MNANVQDTHPPQNADQVDDNVVQAVKTEVQHEVHNIQHTKEPVDPTQSDVLVQKHFPKLLIAIFAFVVVVLLAALAGIAIFGHH